MAQRQKQKPVVTCAILRDLTVDATYGIHEYELPRDFVFQASHCYRGSTADDGKPQVTSCVFGDVEIGPVQSRKLVAIPRPAAAPRPPPRFTKRTKYGKLGLKERRVDVALAKCTADAEEKAAQLAALKKREDAVAELPANIRSLVIREWPTKGPLLLLLVISRDSPCTLTGAIFCSSGEFWRKLRKSAGVYARAPRPARSVERREVGTDPRAPRGGQRLFQ